MTCPANPASNAESGSYTGHPSHTPEPEASPILPNLESLIASLSKVAESMLALAESNRLLSETIVQALAEDQGMEETPTGQYMDGSPVR